LSYGVWVGWGMLLVNSDLAPELAPEAIGRVDRLPDGPAPRQGAFRKLVTSTYDVHDLCNLRCEGCSYFVTDRPEKAATPEPEAYDRFFAAEAARGVTYPIFTGAEPSLNQGVLRIAARHWRYGGVFTNGVKRIDPALPFRVVISLWGGRRSNQQLRGVDSYDKALRTAAGDRRAIVFYTVTAKSIDDIPEAIADCAAIGVGISFNFYSMTGEYIRRLKAAAPHDKTFYRFSSRQDNLALDLAARRRAVELIDQGLRDFPETVLFSRQLSQLMAREGSMHAIDPLTGLATDCAVLESRTHLSFNHDLTRDARKDCCAADLDCRDCRVLGAALATSINGRARMMRSSPAAAAELRELRELMMRLYYWDWAPAGATA
jgi:MoaA/NifB/PqqE/SkfB family radical SAM enzyme